MSPQSSGKKISTLGNKCANCGKTFTRLLQHLKMKTSCQVPYDMEIIEKNQVSKHREINTTNKHLKRKLLSPDKKAEADAQDRERKKISRLNQTPVKKAEVDSQDRKRKKNSRLNQTPEKKAEVEAKKEKD